MPSLKLVKFNSNAVNPEVTNNDDIQYIYTISNFINFSYDISTPITPAPLPEDNASQNVLVKLEGNTGKIKLSWYMKDEEESVVVTFDDNPQTVHTIIQQLAFFKNEFSPVSIEDAYAFVLITNDDNDIMSDNHEAWYGSISNTKFTTSSDKPVTFNATIDFLEGTVISVHDLGVPSPPLNLSLTTNNNRITATWNPPSIDVDDTISGWVIRTIDQGGGVIQVIRNIPGLSFT